MEVLLQGQGQSVLPEGLPELCADIARQIIRYNPENCYAFIANYLQALLVTRSSALAANEVVDDLLTRSEKILEILLDSGMDKKQLLLVVPKLKEVFRDYLRRWKERCECEPDEDPKYRCSINKIMREAGSCQEEADRVAEMLQALMRDCTLTADPSSLVPETLDHEDPSTSRSVQKFPSAKDFESAHLDSQVIRHKDLRPHSHHLRDDHHHHQDWFDELYEIKGVTVSQAHEAAKKIQRAWARSRELSDVQPKVIFTERTPDVRSGTLGAGKSQEDMIPDEEIGLTQDAAVNEE